MTPLQNPGAARVAFVIPVRNPGDSKVRDARWLDVLLERTLESLLAQRHPHVAVITIGHGPGPRPPDDPRLVRLDVSDSDVFRPDARGVQIDKGLRYVLGARWALDVYRADLVLPMDADDYVNVELAAALAGAGPTTKDGWLIDRGVHVGVRLEPHYRLGYDGAFVVDRFDQTCGSCRVFEADALARFIDAIDPALAPAFAPALERRGGALRLPPPLIAEFERRATGRADRHEKLHVLGRHIRQQSHFDFARCELLGAAKGCGHCNHDGPRQGGVHHEKVIRTLDLSTFGHMFGVAVADGHQRSNSG
jgi:hypothetical protein